MKSQKGITLTSVIIYVTIVLIVIGILAVITSNLQGNIKEIYTEGTNSAEVDKFNVYFLKEVKKQGNNVATITNNEIIFSLGSKYTFNNTDKCIYLNDNIKIAETIEKCEFSYNADKEENEKTVITVKIKAINGEEKIIEYVLGNETITGNHDNESDYIGYEIPRNWDINKLNSEKPMFVEIVNNESYIAPIPKGYSVSNKEGENTISRRISNYRWNK